MLASSWGHPRPLSPAPCSIAFRRLPGKASYGNQTHRTSRVWVGPKQADSPGPTDRWYSWEQNRSNSEAPT